MTKDQKAAVIEKTKARLQKANGLYFANFSGMTVAQADDLRSEFYKIGVEYVVVKNTLLKRALQDIGGYDEIFPHLVHQTGVVISYDDPIQPARVLEKFNKANKDKPLLKVCVIDKQIFDGSRLSEIAALPTHNDIIASILGSLNAPAQGIVGAINAVISGIVYAVDAIEKQKAQAA